MGLIRTSVVEDAFFGEMEILTDDHRGTVEVSGPSVPTVVIRRIPGGQVDRFVPIGSRRPEDLTMTVDTATVEIVPGPGKWTRGSYRVRVTTPEADYLFKPNSIATTGLVRNGTKLADFSMDDDEGDFIVYWIQERRNVLPADAAIGYALSVAFRTGAMGFFSLLTRGAEALPQ
ncbi:hypothetical protein [Amycolatopsis anabasis]|uniref:hypothetical protein n=1 Tax=Amycolatopsis anabasis TaxID=1840409 RepID=UPI00131AD12C|nr:hypothetical protein [Amycolatopsis anabasis]